MKSGNGDGEEEEGDGEGKGRPSGGDRPGLDEVDGDPVDFLAEPKKYL